MLVANAGGLVQYSAPANSVQCQPQPSNSL
jgi:hypothetical protein